MTKEALGKCPVCGQNTEVTSISCGECGTRIEGHFRLCRFCGLTGEQKDFIETFVKCRGNIKEVEKVLGISYPTVKNRLEDAAKALGCDDTAAGGVIYGFGDEESSDRRKKILSLLESGELTVEEALDMLGGQAGK